ncbi:hypothetical protein Tco_1413405 [Tanacetum coccineum]
MAEPNSPIWTVIVVAKQPHWLLTSNPNALFARKTHGGCYRGTAMMVAAAVATAAAVASVGGGYDRGDDDGGDGGCGRWGSDEDGGDVVDVGLVWMVGRGWWSGWQRLWPEMPETAPETHRKKR